MYLHRSIVVPVVPPKWHYSMNVEGDRTPMIIGGFSDPRYLMTMKRVPSTEQPAPTVITEI